MSQCPYPSCTEIAHPGGIYCCKRHRDNALGRMKICDHFNCDLPAYPASGYCSPEHQGSATGLVTLQPSDEKYADILNQFRKKWLHDSKCPEVLYIYKVIQPKSITTAYENYRTTVESQGRFQSMGLPEGNERRRFHGTKRACNLGDKGSTMLCSLPECSLCGIIKTSFKLSLAGTAHPWRRKAGRFGAGIYTSATSSKSNDYCKNLPSARSTCKAMLLTKVVAGNGEKLTKTDARRTGPSPGYDSVIGEPDQTHRITARLLPFRYLNYDELVVYDEHAAIPAYLIMYESKT